MESSDLSGRIPDDPAAGDLVGAVLPRSPTARTVGAAGDAAGDAAGGDAGGAAGGDAAVELRRLVRRRAVGGLQAIVGVLTIIWAGAAGRGGSPWVLLGLLALIGLTLARRSSRALQAIAAAAMGLAAVSLLPVSEAFDPDPSYRLGIMIGILALVGGVIVWFTPLAGLGTNRWTRRLVAIALLAMGALGLSSPRQTLYLVALVLGITAIVRGGGSLVRGVNGTGPGGAERSAPQGPGGWFAAPARPEEDRTELVGKLSFEGRDEMTRYIRFLSLMAFATVLAALGVILDSTAVVIGAMLVAPLMTPLMALALSLSMGWPRRSARAAAVAGSGILLAIGLAALLSSAVPIPLSLTTNPQVLGRVSPTLLDLFVALAAGGAGAFALSRTDVSDALPGVAIAISLVPPLTVVGIALERGEWAAAGGALLLFTTNLLSILVAGAVVFVATGMVPVHQLVRSTDWARTTAAALAVSLTLVVVGLAIIGQRIVTSGADQREAIATTEAWLDEEAPELLLRSVGIVGHQVQVNVTGPEPELLELDGLARELAIVLHRAVEVEVLVTPQTRWNGSAEYG